MFGALMDLTGIRSSAFMLMYGVVWVSLIWMYWTEVRRSDLMGKHAAPSNCIALILHCNDSRKADHEHYETNRR